MPDAPALTSADLLGVKPALLLSAIEQLDALIHRMECSGIRADIVTDILSAQVDLRKERHD